MSTQTTTATVSEAEAATPTPSEHEERGTSNTNLYLVTFVATLFLLLFVSCGIVLRSYLLRRRYQRQLNFAIANGAVITPRTPGSRRKRLGVRPRLYETWIAPLGDSDGALKETPSSPDVNEKKLMFDMDENPKSSDVPQGRWADMQPLTVQTVVVKRRIREFGIPPPPPISPPVSTAFQISASPASPANNAVMFRPPLTIVMPASNPSLHPQVQFADQPRAGAVPLPPAPDSQTPRSRRPSILAILTPASATPETPNPLAPPPPRERRTSTGSVLAARERRESATWRTIISPNPSLPVPPPPSAVSPTDEDDWANDENDGPRDSRSPFGRWNPFGARRNGADGGVEMAGMTTVGSKRCGRSTSKNRVRTEMLQISVLVEMPSVKTSRLYGDARSPCTPAATTEDMIARLLPQPSLDFRETDGEGLSGDESDSDSEDGEQEPESLPDLVLGITRLPFYPQVKKQGDVIPGTPPV